MHFSSLRLAPKIKEMVTHCAGISDGKRHFQLLLVRKYNGKTSGGRTVWQYLSKFTMHKLYDPPITLLEICSDIFIPLENDIIYSDIF